MPVTIEIKIATSADVFGKHAASAASPSAPQAHADEFHDGLSRRVDVIRQPPLLRRVHVVGFIVDIWGPWGGSPSQPNKYREDRGDDTDVLHAASAFLTIPVFEMPRARSSADCLAQPFDP